MGKAIATPSIHVPWQGHRPRIADLKPFILPADCEQPRKAVLFCPHENENGITVPFRRALASELREEGIQIEEKQVEGISERGWSLTRHRMQGTKGGDDFQMESRVCHRVLTLEDIVITARAELDVLSREKHVFVLELHGNGVEGWGSDDDVPSAFNWMIMPGSRILVASFAPLHYENCAWSDFKAIGAMGQHEREITAEYSKVRGFSYAEAREELKAGQEEAMKFRGQVRIVEINGRHGCLPKNHPMYDYYYDEKLSSMYGRSIVKQYGKLSGFEENYCAATLQGSGVDPKDVSRVASIVKVPRGFLA